MSSLEHHGIKGQKWGVRRYQNKDGTYTDAGRKRRSSSTAKETHDINEIYRTLNDTQKMYVTAEDNPAKVFTSIDELTDYSAKSFITYDRKKPVSTVTGWLDGNDKDAVNLSVMTRNDAQYTGKGYATKTVQEGIKWLERSGFKKAYWGVHANNVASIKVAQKNGFKYLEDIGDDPIWKLYVKDL